MATHHEGEIFVKRFPVYGLSCVVAQCIDFLMEEVVLGTSADKSIADVLESEDVAVAGA